MYCGTVARELSDDNISVRPEKGICLSGTPVRNGSWICGSRHMGKKRQRSCCLFMQEQHPLTSPLLSGAAFPWRICSSRLEEEGVKTEVHPISAVCPVYIRTLIIWKDLKTFREGLFAVQDVSSMLCGRACGSQGGSTGTGCVRRAGRKVPPCGGRTDPCRRTAGSPETAAWWKHGI